ncbi:RNA methyltransferase [Hydrotalea sp.]|uniref:methyltransferase RsmF C-terminal domain-like protein n=1 Tax=Hydrotalea sp. TaxID=2881279 RepID=UPI002602FF7F|nr:RNA methyltransferase [Hydrotalea sp.]
MLPIAFIESLQGVKGFHRESFIAAHEQHVPVTSIRFNPFKIKLLQQIPFEEIRLEKIPWTVDGWYLKERPSFTFDPFLHGGAYYVQEASSMFIEQILQQTIPAPNQEMVLDISAAPGGKATLLSGYFKNGLVVANEVIKLRAAILTENVIKWGADNIVVTNNDPQHFQRLPHFFDVVLVDAPCSGSGLFRKDTDAIAEWSLVNVYTCSVKQQKIIRDTISVLKPGGLFIYSTCSYSMEEDEAIVDWMVNEYALEPVRIPLQPNWGIVEVQTLQHAAWGYRFFPDQVKGEGFFVAVFRKKQENLIPEFRQESSLTIANHKDAAMIAEWLQLPENYRIFLQENAFRAIQSTHWQPLQQLSKHLYIKKAGIALGNLKGKDFVPSHELALSLLPITAMNNVNVDLDTALQYLRKQLPNVPGTKGWNTISYCGLRLGWIKVLPNRINNYYPVEWRILKD